MTTEIVTPKRPTATRRSAVTCLACTSCPVCGTEECLLLEELGMYCTTMSAAQSAVGGKGRDPEQREEPAA